MAFRLDRAPLVDFCNQYSPRAHPRIARSPPRGGTGSRPPASPWRDRLSRRRARPKPRATTGVTPSRTDGAALVTPALALFRGGPFRRPCEPRESDDHQPRFHGPGAGMLGCQLHLRASAHGFPRPAIHAWLPTRGRPHGRPGDAATPTQSTRTPLVVRPLQRRLETPALLYVWGRPPNRRHSRDVWETQAPRLSRTIPPHRHQPPRRVGACGPGHDAPKRAELESVPRLRMGTPARRIPVEGRITRTSAKKNEVCCARGAFHR